MLPWLPADMDEIDDVFGGDPVALRGGGQSAHPRGAGPVHGRTALSSRDGFPIEELFVVGR
jgi:ribulose 1,5-bisphosphate carboxylase large subunit-like protein